MMVFWPFAFGFFYVKIAAVKWPKMKNKIANWFSLNNTQRGFTFIELLIVTVIIVVMTSIDLSSLTRSQDQQIFNNSFE